MATGNPFLDGVEPPFGFAPSKVDPSWWEPVDDMEDDVEIGSCQWGSGAIGIVGTVHVARPSLDEPLEECCTFG